MTVVGWQAQNEMTRVVINAGRSICADRTREYAFTTIQGGAMRCNRVAAATPFVPQGVPNDRGR